MVKGVDMKELNCLRCNNKMSFLAKEQLQLGKTGWIFGDIPNLISGALKVDIYVCKECRKLEFFAATNEEIEDETPQKTCEFCGTVYDFDYPKCPKCKR